MTISILIVDDSNFSRHMLKKAIQASNIASHVTEACNGLKALDACDTQNFDVIFLDLTMPEMSGYDLLDALKQRNFAGKSFVVSADVQEKAVERCRNLGAAGFIRKPLKESDLIQTLQGCGVIS